MSCDHETWPWLCQSLNFLREGPVPCSVGSGTQLSLAMKGKQNSDNQRVREKQNLLLWTNNSSKFWLGFWLQRFVAGSTEILGLVGGEAVYFSLYKRWAALV